MPIRQIQVNEYECAWCGYKWINRVNGKDGNIPSKCAKCKRSAWINGESDVMTPQEKGLRQRIKHLGELYQNDTLHWRWPDEDWYIDWPSDLSEKFLSIKPRPTIQELKRVIYDTSPLERFNNGSDVLRHRGYLPDPDKPGWLKYDRSKHHQNYKKLLEEEAQKRMQLMIEIMKSRNVHYDLESMIKQQREAQLAEELKPRKTYEELIRE